MIESSIQSIFEVWYSSCLSQQTINDLNEAIHEILKEDHDQNVIELIQHWKDIISNHNNLLVDKAFESWFKTLSKNSFSIVATLTDKNARMKFLRYLMTGTFG